MKQNNYLLIKNKDTNELVYIDYSKNNGYNFTPKNHVKYEGIKVDKLVLIKPTFVEKVLKKKIKKKLDLYLKYMIHLLESDDDSASHLGAALDEISRYRSIIVNNYRVYLDEKYLELLMQKFALLEHELRVKQFEISKREYMKNEELNEKKHKSR
ncbi:MAG: hypothetical protein MR265_01020 [Erysipelotrichaceae bacterium]|nr:hypothetical protein [Erysipelotrichaceae bacterium]